MDTVNTIAIFVLVITAIVFVHELGHYMVARYNGVQVDVFSIGFGPELFAWVDKRGTRWRFAVILLGGYVKMLGDLDGASARSIDPKSLPANQRNRSLPSKSVGQRAAVAVAGPVYNLVFAMVVFFGLFAVYGKSSVIPKVSEVVVASPAEKAGLMGGDTIRSINGVETTEFSKVLELIQANGGKPLTLQILRQEKEMEILVTPVVVTTTDMIGRTHQTAQIGVRFGEVAVTKLNPLEAFWESGKEVTLITGQILVAVGNMITGNTSPKEMAGIISIAKITGAAAKIGVAELLRFMALISINLGIVNLLPIPVLDGGHILLCGLEKLRGKPLTERFQNAVMVTGLFIVIGLMIFSNGNDIVNSVNSLIAQFK